MSLVNKPSDFTAGTKAVASQVNNNFDIIYNDYNGNITTANLAAGAAIVDTQLAAITTAGKVNFTALTEDSEAAGTVAGHDGTNWSSISASTQRYKVLMSMGSTSAASFQSINLGSAASITGELPAANLASDVRIKGWANIKGSNTTLVDSFNVDSVATNGTGKHKVIWDTDFANSAYAVVATCVGSALYTTLVSVTATHCVVTTHQNNGDAVACTALNVQAFGDQ